jgi:peptidoglycan-associated lipoprotein
MNKMNKTILTSIVLIGLLSGCASKSENVKFDNTKKKKEAVVDTKIKRITTKDTMDKETTIVSNISQANSSNSDTNSNSYINKVTSVINGEKIILSSIHFGFDQYKLIDKMITISNENANKINTVVSKNRNIKIKLEGNCDEWGTDEYNYALGLKRTKSVKNALIKNGISSDSIVVVSYGESNPICSKQTSKCWKQNRRVDYNLLP